MKENKSTNVATKMIATALLLLVCLLLIPHTIREEANGATRKKYEKVYQKEWCNKYNGQTEVVLPDRTRVDCVAKIDGKIYAIEHDFGNKAFEAVGQSLYYSMQNPNWNPGIVLILEDTSDYKYRIRLGTIIEYYELPIRVWIIENY